MPILSRKKKLIWRVTLSKKTSLTYMEEKVLKSQKVVVSSTLSLNLSLTKSKQNLTKLASATNL